MTLEVRLCERRHEPIPGERLEALPDTVICVKCSQEIGGEYIVRAVPANIGKTGSLKKNYGSWDVQRIRRRIPPKQS